MGRGHSSSPVPSPGVEGDIPSLHRSPLGASILAPSTPYCFFDKSNTDYYTLTTVNKNPDVWHSYKKHQLSKFEITLFVHSHIQTLQNSCN